MNTAFTAVVAGENVESIGSRAFCGMDELVQVILNEKVDEIAPDAFEGCDAVLFCAEGSAAASFAEANGIPYVIY